MTIAIVCRRFSTMRLSGPILTAAEMRAAEEGAGVSLSELMERAGTALAEVVWRYGGGRPTLILCGPGNNGGDGYVAARQLAARGIDVKVAALAEPKTDLAQAARAGWAGPVSALSNAQPSPVLVDALFGTGLKSTMSGDWLDAFRMLNEKAAFRIAVDLPSGIAADSGENLGASSAELTLALGALKPAHLLQPGAALCGTVQVADISIAADSRTCVLERPHMVPPSPEDHKYRRGYVAIVSGRMAGAAMLSVRAAMHLAGYVAIAGAGRPGPDALVHRRWDDLARDRRVGAMLIGPGLGRDDDARQKLAAVLALDVPLVLDADALMLLGNDLKSRKAILTPHDGEFQELFGVMPGSRIDRARAAAAQCGAVVVLKGANTVIASPSGDVRIAETATGWLASAGTGDVLAGISAALLSRPGADPFEAACTAVWLHGEAARQGAPAFTADDLTGHIPGAVRACL